MSAKTAAGGAYLVAIALAAQHDLRSALAVAVAYGIALVLT
jgi:hypothetical protein